MGLQEVKGGGYSTELAGCCLFFCLEIEVIIRN